MGRLGHFEVFSKWGIPFQVISNHRDRIQQLSKRYSYSFDVYHKAIEWFLHHMNGMVLFRRYTRNLDILELYILIEFSFFITIGKVCMLKSETSLLGVNNVIEWELPSPFNNSCFLHSLFRACSIAGHDNPYNNKTLRLIWRLVTYQPCCFEMHRW
jgi:hypothetical protein